MPSEDTLIDMSADRYDRNHYGDGDKSCNDEINDNPTWRKNFGIALGAARFRSSGHGLYLLHFGFAKQALRHENQHQHQNTECGHVFIFH